jgi:hypothetical protein
MQCTLRLSVTYDSKIDPISNSEYDLTLYGLLRTNNRVIDRSDLKIENKIVMFLLGLSTLLFFYIPQFPTCCCEYVGEIC